MKKMKHIVIVTLLVLWAVSAGAQGLLTTEEVAAVCEGDSVRVTMRAQIPRRSAPPGTTLIHAPLITDGTWKVSLPPIVVQGRRAQIAWLRHEWAADTVSRHTKTFLTKNGGAVDYSATVPFQHWMYGAHLEIETVAAGCGDLSPELSIMAEQILPPPPPPPPPQPRPEPAIVPEGPGVGELLAETFSFVRSASEFDPNEPMRFYDDERDGALTIYYRINDHTIQQDYAENRQTLVNLLAAIEAITASGDVDIERVVVAGFASPEGPFAFNDRLAWERAISVKQFILQNSSMSDQAILVFNGSLDWGGLRRLVAADKGVPLQKEILELLDVRAGLEPEVQSRIMKRIRTMNGGRAWPYLADRIFPLLRNGAFIRVYFNESILP